MEQYIDLSTVAGISAATMIVRAIFTKLLKNMTTTGLTLCVIIATCVLSVISMFAYYGWDNIWQSIVKFIVVWLLSISASLGIEYTKDTMVTKNQP